MTRLSGLRQINCCLINLSKIKVGANLTSPTDIQVNMFLLKVCKLDPKDILKVSIMRNRQEVWVSFRNEDLADEFERRLTVGIEWSDGMFVNGHRLDNRSLHVKVRGVADDVTERTVSGVLGQYGTVSSCTRGTAFMARQYEPADQWWVWDGVWHVTLKVEAGTVVPSYILAKLHPR